MKKIIGILAFSTLIYSCDDGDVIIENIDLTDVQPQLCEQTGILYKYRENQAQIVEFSTFDFNRVFVNQISSTPKTITIDNSSNKFIYRNYNGTVALTSLCGNILDANPSVTEEWVALYGTAEISTIDVKSNNETTNSTTITNYRHSIIFKNIGFQKPDGTIQQYDEFVFGNYDTDSTVLSLGFIEDHLAKSDCDSDYSLYNVSGVGEMRLKLEQTSLENLIQNTSTPIDTPRILVLNDTNTLLYNHYRSSVENSDFCIATSLPIVDEVWKAKNGVSGVSGYVEVTTESNAPGQFKHTVVLKKVTFEKGLSNFLLGDTFVLGTFITTN